LLSGALLLAGLIFGATACAPAQSQPNVEATVAVAVAATQQSINLPATVEAAVVATVEAVGQAAALPQITPIPVEATPPPVSEPALDAEAEQVRAVIQAEVNAAAARDLARLESLYAPEAVVVDRNGTPDDPADDNVWRGWVNIQRRYESFFSSGVASIALVDLVIQVNGEQAMGIHGGAFLDGVFFPDEGLYTLNKRDGVWRITQLEYGNVSGDSAAPAASSAAPPPSATPAPVTNTALYELRVGGQHRYEEPWGWDRGDPCAAWESGNFDDTKPNYRGFNVLLTNNSDEKVPDDWPIAFSTAKGRSVKACFYGYPGAGPPPDATNSVTFFTVVEQGDFVDAITFSLNGNTVQLCLDGLGEWWIC
jgi:hypothetical protein